ncbi:hypothetical protein J4433_00355 [Candidatus Pacearchaeota archaeon]|nr:hypothetical protein [Candidatus Pacearchaeota archaeon]
MADYKALAERVDLSKLRWLERRFLQLADPVNLFLHLIGIIIIVYGLWINVLWWVVIGIIILLIGHAYVESKRKQPAKKGKKAALELSISTIVIIVMAVTMLILGLVLIRTIMCGALVTSLDLTQKMKDQINKLFQETGNDVILLQGPNNLVSIPPGEPSAVWFAFKPSVETEYNYRFEITLPDRYKRAPYNLRETTVESWFTTPLSGKDVVGVLGKEKNLMIKPPKDTPSFEFTLKLKVGNLDRVETQIEVKKQDWAYKAFC